MKKIYLTLTAIIMASCLTAQVRYVEKVFTDVDVTSDVTYGTNITVITGSPAAQALKMDIYEPKGDTATMRPLIIFCPTGSYLPRFVNQQPVGDKTDSATVEFAKEFAKRGYVVANIAYRQGWLILSPDQDVRTGTILNAVYRSIHDAKTAARFMSKTAALEGNPYKIDSTKVAIGGNGTGGYVAINTVSLDKVSELYIDKFINFNKTPDEPYVDTALSGNIDGTNVRPLNLANWANHSANFNFAFTIGGALGDSSWIEPGEVPVVCVHGAQDPFAPYNTGIVFVPGTTTSVVEVSGGFGIMTKVDALGNNAAYKGKVGGNLSAILNGRDGIDGLYTIQGAINGSGPWEWYDTTWIKANVTGGAAIVTNALKSNPNMSKQKAIPFIDTICKYVAPRMAVTMGFVTDYALGVNEIEISDASAYPNPLSANLTIAAKSEIEKITILDLSGKVIKELKGNESLNQKVDFAGFSGGNYILRIETTKGISTLKITKQ